MAGTLYLLRGTWDDLKKAIYTLVFLAIVFAIVKYSFAGVHDLLPPKESSLKFLQEWQELVGAFLGSSLAIIFSGIGFLVVRRVNKADEMTESLRQIEIHNTYGLQSALEMQKKLLFFVDRARKFVDEIRQTPEENALVFSTINFNALGQIHLSPEGHYSHIKSYYLHNKLLVLHAAVTNSNLIITQFREDFAKLTKVNEFAISIAAQRNDLNPKAIREGYAENVEGFAITVEKFAREITQGINIMLQIRIYNKKMRATFLRGHFQRLKYEGLWASEREIELVDEIDSFLEHEVSAERVKIGKRIIKINAKSEALINTSG